MFKLLRISRMQLAERFRENRSAGLMSLLERSYLRGIIQFSIPHPLYEWLLLQSVRDLRASASRDSTRSSSIPLLFVGSILILLFHKIALVVQGLYVPVHLVMSHARSKYNLPFKALAPLTYHICNVAFVQRTKINFIFFNVTVSICLPFLRRNSI